MFSTNGVGKVAQVWHALHVGRPASLFTHAKEFSCRANIQGVQQLDGGNHGAEEADFDSSPKGRAALLL
jgi:hypothetical protein